MKHTYHHRDLRNALVDEAVELLAASGLPALTLRELGRRLGVTHAAAYAHFPDKSALLREVANVGFGRLSQTLIAAREGALDAASGLEAMGRAYVRFAHESPNLYRLMFADETLSHDEECVTPLAGERAFGVLVEAVAALAPGDAQRVHQRSVIVWAMVHGLAMLELDRRLTGLLDDDADVMRTANEIMLAGLRASP